MASTTISSTTIASDNTSSKNEQPYENSSKPVNTINQECSVNPLDAPSNLNDKSSPSPTPPNNGVGDKSSINQSNISPGKSNFSSSKVTFSKKPEMPDIEKYEADLAAAQDALNAAISRLEAAHKKLETCEAAKDTNSASETKRLKDELADVCQKQQTIKTSRSGTLEKIKLLQVQLKNRVAEQNAKFAKFPYKTAQEVDQEISRLEAEVDSGKLKIVEECKYLNDITQLKKRKAIFLTNAKAQKEIDNLRAQVDSLRATLDDPESRQLATRFTEISDKLRHARAINDEQSKHLKSLREERNKAYKDRIEKAEALRKLKNAHYTAMNNYRIWKAESRRIQREKFAADRIAQEKLKRITAAERRLEEASIPAFQEQILHAENLVRFFDPTFSGDEKNNEQNKFINNASSLASLTTRKTPQGSLDASRIIKKDSDEDYYFVGGRGKKSKKSTKRQGAATSMSLDVSILEQLGKLGIDPPVSTEAVPEVINQLKTQITKWRVEQEEKTRENVKVAQAELEKLKLEITGAPNKPPASTDEPTDTPACENNSPVVESMSKSASELISTSAHPTSNTTSTTTDISTKAPEAVPV